MKTTLLMVDSSEMARLGMREIVARLPDFEVVGGCTGINGVLLHLQKEQPNIVLLSENIGMKALLHGLGLLARSYPHLKLVVIATAFNADTIEEYAALGVLGFLCKHDRLIELLPTALQTVAQGDPYLSPSVTRTVLTARSTLADNLFNQRQMRVLRLMALYHSPQEIAKQMCISTASVYSLQYRMRAALGVKTSGQLLVEALKRGWIDSDDVQ